MNILLTSVGRRTYLVEYFKKALEGRGLVYVTNSSPSPGFAAADYAIVSPLIYDENYIPFLLSCCRENNIGLLIPLFDVDIPVLARHREEFEALGTTLVTADLNKVLICNDKWKTFCSLTERGIRTPHTCLSLEEAREKLSQRWGNVIVKPRWGMGSLAVYEAENMQELEVFYQKVHREVERTYMKYESRQNPDSCVVIQQKLEGQEYGLDVMNDLDGAYQSTSVKKKLAMRAGETDCAETVQMDELEELGKKLGMWIGHRGNLDVDVFSTEKGFYVLEMNVRFGGGYPFSHMAGADLPRAIVNWKMGNPVKREWLECRPGVKCQKEISLAPAAF